MRRQRRRAFTLVELLVVIAIIGILVSLLLPAVQSCREAARRTQCVNHLTQLILAVQSYEMAFREYPPGTIEEKGPILNKPVGYHHNWLSRLLPYIEEKNAYNHIDFDVGVYDPKNLPVRQLLVQVFMCPSQGWHMTSGDDISLSGYAGVHNDVEAPIDEDNHGVFFLNSSVRYEDISDGTSHTLFIGDKVCDEDEDLGWMSGTRWTLRNTGSPIQPGNLRRPVQGARQGESAEEIGQEQDQEQEGGALPVGGFGAFHPGGANFAFGDGHVGFIAYDISPKALQQLGNRADGELPLNEARY